MTLLTAVKEPQSEIVTPRSRPWLSDALGITWVIASGFAVLLPALLHGSSLGPIDLLSQYGLSKRPGAVYHNGSTIDLLTQQIPWGAQAWTQVHGGHLPLWNPENLLGMPLAFNWLSAPFSVPSLIGYLFPLHLAYTVQIIVTLVIAGTGVYALGRVLDLGVLGCVMAATVCELSGPYMAWLGWPQVQSMAWAGWMFAAALLIIRGRHRARAVAMFAIVTAFVIYSGFPEIAVLLGLSLLVFLTIRLTARARWLGGSGPILRPVIDVALASAAGAALGAPLVLPGLQLTAGSVRSALNLYGPQALPSHGLLNLIFQGFYGLPEANSRWFDPSIWYPLYLIAYVGVITVLLAGLALVSKRRRPEVVAFGAIAVITGGLAFFTPLVQAMQTLPLVGRTEWAYALMPLAFSLAVLAGVGTDVLVHSYARPVVRYSAGGAFVGMALLVLAVWMLGRHHHLPQVDAQIRARSFIWPVIEVVVGLAAFGVLAVTHRGHGAHHFSRRRSAGLWAAAALVACETAFLVASGAPVMSSSPTFLPPTRAVSTLQRAVGSSLVGCGVVPCWDTMGILPNVNVVYRVQEFAVYDPSVPKLYFDSWNQISGAHIAYWGIFGPSFTSTTEARLYGVAFVLEPRGTPGPPGAIFDQEVGDEDLYRIPGAAQATLVPDNSSANASFPKDAAKGTPIAVSHPDPSTWKLVMNKPISEVLRLRLTDVPGWHASIDGRPLRLYPFSGVMLQAHIPPGPHSVELHYWPTAFTAGIALAALSTAGLLTVLLVPSIRRRRVVLNREPAAGADS